jgi:hypothetical protein
VGAFLNALAGTYLYIYLHSLNKEIGKVPNNKKKLFEWLFPIVFAYRCGGPGSISDTGPLV